MKTAALFEALGSDTRYNIIKILMKQKTPLSVGEISRRVGGSSANTSRALSHLLRVGAVDREIRVNQRLYSVRSEVASLVEQANHLKN